MAALSSPPSENAAYARPYPPSWVNTLTRGLDRLPAPSWRYYVGMWLVLFGVTTVIEWRAGTYPVGTYNLFHLAVAAGVPYILALIHYLSNAGDAALQRFRAVLNIGDAEYQDLKYRLTMLPARATLFWMIVLVSTSLIGMLFTGTFVASMQISNTPLSLAWGILLVAMWDIFGAAWFYQMYRQMRMVSQIYAEYVRIDVFNQNALYGFSGLLLRASLGVIFGVTSLFVIAEGFFQDVMNIASTLLGLMLAVAIFILPLLQIHGRLQNEKERLLGETNNRIENTVTLLHRRIDTRSAAEISELKDILDALELEQRILQRIPTWPWAPETFRLLVSALLFPIVVFSIQYIVGKLAAAP
ncbi:MAG: hypothetical protein HY741_00695 [Chloroflexi bacterium]|nr:hypothetical protein [Chloroflexota bacterium]